MQFPETEILELELTSKCTVKCPNCPRTFQADKRHLWDNGHIDADKLIEFLKTMPIRRVLLTGAYGDGLYHPHLIKAIKAIKEAEATFHFDTNGSYRKPKDWEQIRDMMTLDDTVTFSLDGTPENFTQYRVNADWPTIEAGAKILGEAKRIIIWKYIVFKYNCSFEDMRTAYDTANDLGFYKFQIIDTHRAPPGQLVDKKVFNTNLDKLEEHVQQIKDDLGGNIWKTPVTKLQIDVTPRTAILTKKRKDKTETKKINWNKPKGPELTKEDKPKEIIKLPEGSKKERNYGIMPEVAEKRPIVQTENVYPQCMNIKDYANFISSEGLFLPCCFMRVDQQVWFDSAGITEEDIDSMSIYKHDYKTVISGSGFKKIMNNFENIGICKRICSKKKIQRREY